MLDFIGGFLRKSIRFELNKFPVVPDSLRDDPKLDKAKSSVEIDVGRLFHHYYIDKFGKRPPSPDLAQFEPSQFFVEEEEFRFIGEGYGNNPAAKQAGSNQLVPVLERVCL